MIDLFPAKKHNFFNEGFIVCEMAQLDVVSDHIKISKYIQLHIPPHDMEPNQTRDDISQKIFLTN